jgi:hypothetical protein
MMEHRMRAKSDVRIAVIFVCFGPRHVQTFRDLLVRQGLTSERVEVIVVDTSRDQCSNAAFEFSGYQTGAQIAAARFKAMGHSHGPVRLLFVNDTAVSSHLAWLWLSVLRKLSDLVQHSIERGRFYGFPSKLPQGFEPPGARDYYVSTWLFGIDIELSSAGELELYKLPFTDRPAFMEHYERLDSSYRTAINRWLMPTNFFKGWHKATVIGEHDSDALARKRFTIYCEHRLPGLLEDFGMRCIPLADIASRFGGAMMRGALLIDRMKINLLKLKFRCHEAGVWMLSITRKRASK